MSNLAAEDAHFKTHRDSVEILRKHGAEEGHKNINQKLLDTQDSFVLTRGKMGKGKKTERLRGLSPIWDASPPNNAGRVGFEDAMLRMDVERKDEAERRADPEDFKGTYSEPGWEGSHPPEHVGCPIYEVERPRWFEGRHGRKLGT